VMKSLVGTWNKFSQTHYHSMPVHTFVGQQQSVKHSLHQPWAELDELGQGRYDFLLWGG